MIINRLFQRILLDPVIQTKSTKLVIVSGYAAGSLAYKHLDIPEMVENGIEVDLIVGMAKEGINLADNTMFLQLAERETFNCYYRIVSPDVHSKVYVWMADDKPIKAFVGSANYTEPGFLRTRQENAMVESDAKEAYDYYCSVLSGTMEITHDDIENHIRFYRNEHEDQLDGDSDCISISLLTRDGEVAERSGLNWGQRPEYNRNRNQAYIQIGAAVARSGFFPPGPDQRFTVVTDDGLSMTAVRAQKDIVSRGGDAIETPEGNHILGAYFRARLGVPGGTLVTRQHLEAYGRTDVVFCKLDEDEFSMDFSLP